MTAYYVSKSTGNDGNSGLTPLLPKKTLAALCALVVNPDDFGYLLRGDTWTAEQISVLGSGTAGHPITFDAYGDPTSPLPIITMVGDGSVVVSSQNYVTIRYLHCTGSSYGVWYLGTTSNLLVQFCETDTMTVSGVVCTAGHTGNNCVTEFCTIHDCLNDGWSVTSTGSGFICRYCTIYNLGNQYTGGPGDAITAHSTSSGAAYGNVCYNGYKGGWASATTGGAGWDIYNNVFIDFAQFGISQTTAGGLTRCWNCIVVMPDSQAAVIASGNGPGVIGISALSGGETRAYNCTVINTCPSSNAWSFYTTNAGTTTKITVRNCISYCTGATLGRHWNWGDATPVTGQTNDVDFNLYYPDDANLRFRSNPGGNNAQFAAWRTTTAAAPGTSGNNKVLADPLFVNPTRLLNYEGVWSAFVASPKVGADAKLLPASPALNVGQSQSTIFTNDLANVSRPQGSAWDMGAYELATSASTLVQGLFHMKSALRWRQHPKSFAIAMTTAVATYVDFTAAYLCNKVICFTDADATLTLTLSNTQATPGALTTPAAPGNITTSQFTRRFLAYQPQIIECGSAGTDFIDKEGGGAFRYLNVLQSSGGTVNLYGEAAQE